MLVSAYLRASQEIIIVRGERPPIDLNAVPTDSYEPGVLMIKLHDSHTERLENKPAVKNDEGHVRFSIQSIDLLNDRYKAREVDQFFRHPSLGNKFSERHKAWGFHLWYRLEFDDDVDVIDLVRKYEALDDVVIAEPEYRKRLISDPALSYDDIVSTFEDRSRWTPNDPSFGQQWHYQNTGQQSGTPGADIDLVEAWDIEKGHDAVVVAIIDDGIQFNHPDLAANMWQNADGHYGYNFVNNTSTISPGNHGTHVAGTVAAVTNNNVGVAGVAGGSGSGDGVRLMSCQVFTASSNGGFHVAPIWAADNGAAISQNSWGYSNPGVYEQAVLDAIDYFNSNGGGNVMDGGITIFAAGNDNDSGNWYPGYYSGAFSVAATNNQDQKAWYSTYGTWVDISAPGGETNAVNARGVLSTITGSNYAYYQGTSMACPHVSGVAALLLSNAYRQNHILENEELWGLLVDNVDDHYAQNPGFLNQLGSGRLNANLALMALEGMLSGLINPSDFSAVAVSTSQIDLEWTKNLNDHDVMLVYSQDGSFGTPENGTAYAVGNTIPGGGVVLFRGAATSFNHTGLEPATAYYYRAFSFNDDDEYSSGRSTHAVTFCDVFDALPFAEDFDASTSLPYCWEIVDHQGNGQVWQFGTHANGLEGTTGNYAFLNSDAFGWNNSQNADLITPVLDLTGFKDVVLSFTHYFRQYESASTAKLSYSIDGGATWTEIESWTSTTDNPEYFDEVIAAVTGQPAVRFKWNYTGSWGYYWNVDDIEIAGQPFGPYADFIADPLEVFVGETVFFTDASGGGEFSSWEWDFGDGAIPATATGQGPHQVVYSTPGEKTISLTVDNEYSVTKQDYVTIVPVTYSSSNTYGEGDLATDRSFTSLPGSSACPGILSVTIPVNATITGVDVSYEMTTGAWSWRSDQRSQLRCVSPGGTNETELFSGTGNTGGTQFYERTGLDIANNVTGGGEILFELHAGRTWGGNGCGTNNNKVDNNSWTVTVYYSMDEEDPECFPVSMLDATNIGVNGADLNWTDGGTGVSWNIEWGLSGFAPGSGHFISGIEEKPYALSGLDSGTTYDFYVQAVCSNDKTAVSEWAGPQSFTTLIEYVITAEANNPAFGTVTGGGIYEHGDEVLLTATPNTGYHFVAWEESDVVVSTDPEYTFTAESNRSLIAIFAINTYTLEYTAGDNGLLTGETFQEVAHGGDGTPVEAIPDPGYSFTGWSDAVSDNPRTDTNVEENISVTAHFAIDVYTITAQSNNPAFGTVTGGGIYEHGDEVLLTATPNTGYHFVAWEESDVVVSTDPEYTFTAESNRSLIAIFAINTYTLEYTAGDNGLLTGETFQEVSHGGDGTPVEAIADPGYSFTGWSDGMMDNPRTETNVQDHLSVTAHFAIDVYTITAQSNNPAFGTVTGGGIYEHGDEVLLTATPNTGYHFVAWEESDVVVSTDAEYTFTAEADRTLTAVFAINEYVITAEPNNPAFGEVTGDGTYEHGAPVTLTAIPNTGYHFVAWEEEGLEVSTDPEYTFTAEADRTLTAVFAINEYVITAEANNPAFGTVTGGGTFEHGTPVTLTATPETGYHFVAWEEEGLEVSTDAEYTFTAEADRSLTAVFAINTYTLEYTAGANGSLIGTTLQEVEHGSDGTPVEAVPDPGYSFTGWSDAVMDNPRTDMNVQEDISVTAQFAIDVYTITAEANNPAFGTVTGGGIYEHGDEVLLTATPNTGYHFISWEEEGAVVSTDPEYTFPAEADRTLVGVFVYDDYQDIQDVLFLDNHIVSTGQSLCFDALQTVYIGGEEGLFIVESGADVSVIAGNSIILLPGTKIAAGAYFQGSIRPDGPFCNGITIVKTDAEISDHRDADTTSDADIIKMPEMLIYPNPTDGDFILEIRHQQENCTVEVEIFSHIGERIHHYTYAENKNTYGLTLHSHKPGMYYVRVITCNWQSVQRIIKHR